MENVNRRSFLNLVGAAGVGVAASPLLTACGSPAAAKSGTTSTSQLSKILPAYVPSTGVTPDIPGVNGADPAFLNYPADPVATVKGVPGSGGSYKVVTPLWGSAPPSSGNAYYDAVNKALGATVTIQPADGNHYDTVVPPLFAAGQIPDWIQIPGWYNDTFNIGGLASHFADLTPYLSGDNVKVYPNLANIPTGAWQQCVWNNKIYALPCWSSSASVSGALFYRKDILDAKGLAEPKSADDLTALGKALTDPSKNVWAFDDLWTYLNQPFAIAQKYAVVGGKLQHKYESPQFLEALDWCNKTAKAGYIHPDALAGNTGAAKDRFTAGKVAIYGDGTGAWLGMWGSRIQAGDTAFKMQAMAPFAADGKSAVTTPLADSASMFSYLNKSLTPAQVKECLAIANYLAAPFGSAEYTLIKYGVKGVDYALGAGGPALNARGQKEVADTYDFLVTPPAATVDPDGNNPEGVRAYAAWQAAMMKTAYRPVFFDMNITVPTQFKDANGGQAVEDAIKDVCHGRKSVSDFQAAVTTWKKNGGDQLTAFYETVRAQNGTGQ